LANEIKFSDGIARYEHLFGHAHHDHLICTECGKLIEVVDSEIEALQNKLAQKHHFTVTDHHVEIYGQCPDCQNQK
jgi:Fur family ferric uptake transcriptional regulator